MLKFLLFVREYKPVLTNKHTTGFPAYNASRTAVSLLLLLSAPFWTALPFRGQLGINYLGLESKHQVPGTRVSKYKGFFHPVASPVGW